MTKKNSRKVSLGHVPMVLLWVTLGGLTLLRLIVACSGSLGESEAFLALCAAHPAGGYVEGPCGVPLLTALILMLKPLFGGSVLLALRCFSPLAALLLSWCIWWIGRRLAPHRPAVALWSVLGVNLLPWVNLASLLLDGAMVTAVMILLCLVAGWNAVLAMMVKGKQPLLPWLLFGASLGFGTLFFYPIGWLLLIAVVLRLRLHGMKGFPSQGVVITLGLLIAGWSVPLFWNARHDWIEWSSVARGFDSYALGGAILSLSLCVTVSALIVPTLVLLASDGLWLRRGMTLLLVLSALGSTWVLALPSRLPTDAPSPLGVRGMDELARAVLALKKERLDAKGATSFLIAQSSGLAALLGEKITLTYPERSGAPSVFMVESPSMNSSFSLWPSYADAVAPAAKDINYTEAFVSPFLGRNALYITTEAPGELPQTITGAFGAVGLLKEVPIIKNGQAVTVRIYQCEGYRTLAL